jgi:hypothetical protein
MKKIQENEVPVNSVAGGGVVAFDPLLSKKLVKKVQKILKKKSLKEGNEFRVKHERIDREITDKGYNHDKRTKGYMAHVNPNHFVHSTTPSDEHRERIKKEAGKFDHERFHGEHQTPTLHVEKQGNKHVVVGHEGRHRMQALADAGHKKVPVVIKFSRGAERSPKKKLKLHGEYRGTVHVHNATPLHHDHRDELKKRFSE